MAQPADPLRRSRNAGQAYVDFALAEPQAYRLMFDLNQPTEGDYPELQNAIVRARRTMTVHIEAMIEAGQLEGDAELIGHLFWSVLHGMLMLQLTGKLAPSIDPGKLRQLAQTTLVRGLGITTP